MTEKHETAHDQAAPPPAQKIEATPKGAPGYMPSINEPEGSTVGQEPGEHTKTAHGQKPGGTELHRLDNDPKVKNGDDDDDDDNGGTTRTRTTTVKTTHKR